MSRLGVLFRFLKSYIPCELNDDPRFCILLSQKAYSSLLQLILSIVYCLDYFDVAGNFKNFICYIKLHQRSSMKCLQKKLYAYLSFIDIDPPNKGLCRMGFLMMVLIGSFRASEFTYYLNSNCKLLQRKSASCHHSSQLFFYRKLVLVALGSSPECRLP